jgi:hypothetical protein
VDGAIFRFDFLDKKSLVFYLVIMAIYKYVTVERIDIFKNGHIRFTQPSAFNDPFETFPYFSAIAPEDAVDDFLKKQPKVKNTV